MRLAAKRSCLLQVWLKYEREQRRDALAAFSALDNPVLAIDQLFSMLIEQSLTDVKKKGCFLVNTALDLPNHDEDIQEAVKKGLKGTETFFEQQLVLGIARNEIPTSVDPKRDAKGVVNPAYWPSCACARRIR